MTRVLVLYYSQTGQLRSIMRSIAAPLYNSSEFEVTELRIQPTRPVAFPWSFWRFFDAFPECVYDDPPPIEPLPLDDAAEFDLVILGYPVWFISPALPVTAFLQGSQAERLLRGKPVVTVISCRNMWLMAQERVKAHLQRLGANLIDNIVLADRTHGAKSVITTPWWMLTGNQGPYLNGLLPRAGVWQADIDGAARFGDVIAKDFPARDANDTRPLLWGMGAVRVHPGLIASEQVVQRSFRVWGRLLRLCGKSGTPLRRVVLALYVVFLVAMLVTVVPIVFVLKMLLAPLTRKRIQQQRAYFAAPSGE